MPSLLQPVEAAGDQRQQVLKSVNLELAKGDVVIYPLLIIFRQVSQNHLYGFFRETGTTYIPEHDP